MGAIVKKLSFFIVVMILTGCTTTMTYKEPTITETLFVDENHPPLTINFPFEIEIHNQETRTIYSDENAQSRYTYYSLATNENNTGAGILKQNLWNDGHFTFFRETDDLRLKEKFYFTKNKHGYCAVIAGKNFGLNMVGSEITKYTASKYLTSVRIYQKLPDDYDYSRLLDEDSHLLDKHAEFAEAICAQLIGEDTVPRVPSSKIDMEDLTKKNTTFIDQATGKTWHILSEAGLVEDKTAQRFCHALETKSGNPARLPTVLELERLWKNNHSKQSFKKFARKTYLSNELIENSSSLSIAVSLSSGISDRAFTANLTCVEE